MSQQTDRIMISDKLGRLICIDDLPAGWKITPRQRDMIFQSFLGQFPKRDWSSSHAKNWMELESKRWPISSHRISHIVRQGVESEAGKIDRAWRWWVGCSLQVSNHAPISP